MLYHFVLSQDYDSKRDYIVELLAGIGFQVQFKPQGSFFLFAELPENFSLSDVSTLLFVDDPFIIISRFYSCFCSAHFKCCSASQEQMSDSGSNLIIMFLAC